jgi:hypothetical protein
MCPGLSGTLWAVPEEYLRSFGRGPEKSRDFLGNPYRVVETLLKMPRYCKGPAMCISNCISVFFPSVMERKPEENLPSE